MPIWSQRGTPSIPLGTGGEACRGRRPERPAWEATTSSPWPALSRPPPGGAPAQCVAPRAHRGRQAVVAHLQRAPCPSLAAGADGWCDVVLAPVSPDRHAADQRAGPGKACRAGCPSRPESAVSPASAPRVPRSSRRRPATQPSGHAAAGATRAIATGAGCPPSRGTRRAHPSLAGRLLPFLPVCLSLAFANRIELTLRV
jgi:hypothetical protein